MIRGLAIDVGLPLIAYYGLHLLGATDWVALLTATAVAGLRLLWGLLVRREINQFAIVMLLVYGIGLTAGLVTGDPRVLLLKDSFVTASVGLVFLGTALLGKPLTLASMQSFAPRRATELQQRFAGDPTVRRAFRSASYVWGIGLLSEAVLRIPIVYLLPIATAYGTSEALFILAMVLLIAWTVRFMRRLQPTAQP